MLRLRPRLSLAYHGDFPDILGSNSLLAIVASFAGCILEEPRKLISRIIYR